MRPTKWYVWNDTIQELVVANHPMRAVAEALSRQGWTQQTDIPEDRIKWPYFYCDQRGFRNKPELISITVGETWSHAEIVQEGAQLPIMKEAALNWFDAINSKLDPFCEYEDEEEEWDS